MIDALEAIKAELAPLDIAVHLFANEGVTDTSVPEVPYIELSPANGSGPIPRDLAVCGPSLARQQFELRLRAMSYPSSAPPKVLNAARNILTPDLTVGRILTATLLIDLQYEGRDVDSQQDRDLFIAAGNRHPSWGSDAYAVHIQTI